MTGKDMVITISTFLMGMFAGAYFYVSVFAPSYEGVIASDIEDADAFIIEGAMYGSCEEDDTCASFQLVEGREYRYMPYADAEVQTGKLSTGFRPALKSAFTEEMLSHLSRRGAEVACGSTQGGVDFSYSVSRGGNTYELDTCSTLLASDDASEKLLLDVWQAFEDPEIDAPQTNTPSFTIEGLFDAFFDRFHNGPQEAQ
jgi:hypothetical protein